MGVGTDRVEFSSMREELSKHDREYLQFGRVTKTLRGKLVKSLRCCNELEAKFRSSSQVIVSLSHHIASTKRVRDQAWGAGFRLKLQMLKRLLLA